ncbi:unnamed protein product [Paramecium primaurelia]|uniref:H-type lectin domain-containing protein n=1 Tax=Paramecium primaurelia TaxID=5886 RepID=A0A8S1NP96_PARPR|nr:unnamed protein product [Paramecium primaurelia]
MTLFLLFILSISAFSFIFSDSGQYQLTNGADFSCQNNFQTTRTISFSGAFQNIPQVFMFQDYFDISNVQSEYQFSITSITLNDFSFLVKCPRAGLIWSIRYEWIAIDDSRVQVINSFNVDPPQDKVLNHQLLNSYAAIIGLTSLGYSGKIEFQLLVTQLTKDTVSVAITQVPGIFQNLKQIGYQILLVASRDIIDLGLVKFKLDYTSNAINLESNKWLIMPIQGMNLEYIQQMRFKAQKTFGASTATFSFLSWVAHDQSEYTVQSLWMSYQLIKIMHQNALLQESVRNQIDHKAIDLHFLFKYCKQIKYIMLLENIPLGSINLFRISILLLKQIVLQENEQYLNLINVILALLMGRIINLIINVTLKLIQQVIFPSSLKYNLLIKNLKQLQQPLIVQQNRYFIIKQKQKKKSLIQNFKIHEKLNLKQHIIIIIIIKLLSQVMKLKR